jgi:hypothetical protein
VAASGDVYALHDSCVSVFHDDGSAADAWGSPGTGAGEFSTARGIALDGAGNVYVTDKERRVQKFDSGGQFLLQWGDGDFPGDAFPYVAVDGDEVFVAMDSHSFECPDRVERRSPSGELLGAACPSEVFSPGAHGVAARGGVVLVVTDGNVILRVDTTEPAATLVSASPVLTGTEVAFDASGSNVPLRPIAHYEWDLDGDGSYETDTGTTPTAARPYDARGLRTVSVRVTAPSGRTATASRSFDLRAAPPPGVVGVTINGGARFTNDADVVINPVWPAFASTLTLSNDGGFASAGQLPVESAIPWTLDSSGRERLPNTVYVRFDASPVTFQDDIVLDQRPPEVTSAVARPAAATSAEAVSARARRYVLALRAADDNSGLARMQFADDRRRPRRARKFTRVVAFGTASVPRFARVEDRAGNLSRWRRVASVAASLRSRRVSAGRPIRIAYSAPRAGRLVVKLIRGRRLFRRRAFEVDPGRGAVTVSSRRLRPGRYRVRVVVGGSTIDMPLRIR